MKKTFLPEGCIGCKYFGTYFDEKIQIEVPTQPNAIWKGCVFNEKPNIFCHRGMETAYTEKDKWCEE